MKILLDTDPGSDIDDAIALAYLARHPEIELLGVTTVTGDVRKRAAIVEVVLRAFGREDVPIVAGAPDTLFEGVGQPHVPHYEAIADLPHCMDRPVNAAVDFLREQIRANPGEVTLVAIGPLTNVATMLLVDPEISGLIKQVVSMAGWFHFDGGKSAKGSEWNVHCDGLASAIFFDRCTCPLTVVPLDVTLKCRLGRDSFRERFADAPKDVVLRMADAWFKGTEQVIFHDPLACALLLKPELCGYRTGRVSATERSGYTFLSREGDTRVAETVDVDGFFEEYFRVLG